MAFAPPRPDDEQLLEDWDAFMKTLRVNNTGHYHLVNRYIDFIVNSYENVDRSAISYLLSPPAIGLWVVVAVEVFAIVTAILGILTGDQAVEIVRILAFAAGGGGALGGAGSAIYLWGRSRLR